MELYFNFFSILGLYATSIIDDKIGNELICEHAIRQGKRTKEMLKTINFGSWMSKTPKVNLIFTVNAINFHDVFFLHAQIIMMNNFPVDMSRHTSIVEWFQAFTILLDIDCFKLPIEGSENHFLISFPDAWVR